MELDKGLELAVTLGWNDLITDHQLLSARVEYESKQGKPMDSLSVWTVRSWGYQDRVCDYWTCASPAHPMGVRFSNSYHSDALAAALDFVMKNQDQFTRPADVLASPSRLDRATHCRPGCRSGRLDDRNPSAREAGRRHGSKSGRAAKPSNGSNGTTSDPRVTSIAANDPAEVAKSVDHRSGFPNGPFCR